METTGGKISGASIIFLDSSNQVLLFLRDDKEGLPYRNCWDVPGGGIEEGETPEEAIKREMMEEIELELNGPLLFNVFDFGDRIEYTFWKQADLDISALTQHEGQAMRWFSEQEIADLADDRIAYSFKPILLEFFREILT